MIKWEKYRDQDGYIDLVAAYRGQPGKWTYLGESYLFELSKLQRMKSRQAAALAIMAAKVLDGEFE